jgi:ABC-type antimicrobial peptide transport system permease subunit
VRYRNRERTQETKLEESACPACLTGSESVVKTYCLNLRDIDDLTSTFDIYTISLREIEGQVSRPRLYTVLLGIFAAISVTLAGIGIYRLTAHSVVRRTREIVIRRALGASALQVRNLVIRLTRSLRMFKCEN